MFFRVRSNYDIKPNLNNDGSDANVPFSTVYGLKQNFKLINLSNQSLNIIPNIEKTSKIGSDDLAVGHTALELPLINSEDITQIKCDKNNIQRISSTESPTGLRKRNVNWNVPIQSRLLTKENVGENYGQSQVNSNLSELKLDEDKEELESEEPEVARRLVADRVGQGREPTIDDDGFESLNGKSSSGEDNAVLTSSILTNDLSVESNKSSISLSKNVNESKQSCDGASGTTEHLMVS